MKKKIFFTFGILLVLGLLVVGGVYNLNDNNKEEISDVEISDSEESLSTNRTGIKMILIDDTWEGY